MTAIENQFDAAVYVNRLCKSYKNGEPILQNVRMNVKKGTIYGLLGPSGCGKTTIISCIVGLAKWDSGSLLVFGEQPGPGRDIGFMPQDLALYNFLSTKEIVHFYGKICDMKATKITEQLTYLCGLLQLSSTSQRIGNLSGGQQRRVSLALALLRSPDLLVLDEPTVGLDPLLRVRIWNHLDELVNTRGATVLLTTHYTEEVRHSHNIGVMRKGRLILEDNPNNFLEQYNCQFLEQAVLELCRTDKKEEKIRKQNSNEGKIKIGVFRGKLRANVKFNAPRTKDSIGNTNVPSFQRIWALITLNLVRCWRTPLVLGYAFFCNAFQIALSVLILGTIPKNLGIGVVNGELPSWKTDCNFSAQWTNTCDTSFLSCKFLNQVGSNGIMALRPYLSEADAMRDASLGNIWGYLTIPENYSHYMLEFGINKQLSENETLLGSRIYTRLDYSEFIAACYMVSYLLEFYLEFAKQLAVSCGMKPEEVEVPLKFHAIDNGYHDDSFTGYMLPGIILVGLLSLTCVLVGTDMITDRKQGTFSRSIIAGISFTDVVLSNLLTQFIINIVQILSVAGLLYFIFSYSMYGSPWISLIICLLTGQCAACLGIFVGIFLSDEKDVVLFGICILFLTLAYGGVVWPSECMAKVWQYLGHLLPASYPAQSLRYVAYRGLPVFHPLVWPGFAAIFIWISGLLVCSFFV